jgi:hypothetical protein
LKLYFFFQGNDNKPIGNVGIVDLGIDTRAPAMAGNISVEVGSTLLFVNVKSTTDSDAKQWRVYCDPPSGSKDAGDVCAATTEQALFSPLSLPALPDGAPDPAEAGSDAGTDATLDAGATDAQPTPTPTDAAATTDTGAPLTCGLTTPAGACGPTYLKPGGGSTTGTSDEAGTSSSTGSQTITNAIFECGTFDITSTTLKIEGLKNDTPYNIAVATLDAYGNVGPLSNVACQTPQEISDFWDEYKKAGGKAGGSFCALEAAGLPAETAVFGFSIVGAALVLAKRRRRS